RPRLAGRRARDAGRFLRRELAHLRGDRPLPARRLRRDRPMVPRPRVAVGVEEVLHSASATLTLLRSRLATAACSGQDATAMPSSSLSRRMLRDRKRRSVLLDLLPRVQGDERTLGREERLVREMLETSLKLLRDASGIGDLKLLNAAL